ncbi:MAG TPA: glycosyltransferase, partial [Ferruginibacter sp.]|nr:glycosyltransferase [Ferruginibacter sp.]
QDNNTRYLGKMARIISRIDERIQNFLTRKKIKRLGSFSYPVLGTNVARLKEIKNADFIYIHWALMGLLNFRSIKNIARLNKPVIIFQHDMWSITGGCHHSFTCEKYRTEGCNDCPMFPEHKRNDLSFKEFGKKMRLYSKYNNLFFVSPSRWLNDCTGGSLLTRNKPAFYIPNIFDSSLFNPMGKDTARQILNIDTNETVIAFGAVSVDSPYKGWAYLQKALELLKEDGSINNISVLIFGSSYSKEIDEAIPFKAKFMGYLKDEYSISLVYNAADVFVVPSLADNLPTTVLESLSCGTPVVGFNIGGIPDMISHKENGYLAKYKDANDVCEGIKFCLQYRLKGYLLPNFAQELTIQKHLELFEHIKSGKY